MGPRKDMRSPLNAAHGWLKQAENARKTAEQLTDGEAKEVMAQLGQMYFLMAQRASYRSPDWKVLTPLLSSGCCNAATA